MSLAYYIVLEHPIDGFDHGVNGKSLARAGKFLDQLAARVGVKPLMHFFSASTDDVRAFDHDADVPSAQTIVEQWFPAEDGLRTVKKLRVAIDAATLDRKADVLTDLIEFEVVLEKAQLDGIRWHLAIDY